MNDTKRKIRLLDRRFQLPVILKVLTISVTGCICIILFLVISSLISHFSLFGSLDDLNNAIRVQNNIVGSFVEFSKLVENNQLILASKKIQFDHAKSIQIIQKYLEILRNAALRNLQLLIFIIVIMIIQGIFIYFILLKTTHRIIGPMKIIDKYIDTLLKGKKPEYRELRKNDELKDLYEKIIKIGALYLKEREKNKILRKELKKCIAK